MTAAIALFTLAAILLVSGWHGKSIVDVVMGR